MSLALQTTAALKLRVAIRLVADAVLVAILLFASAGTFTWGRAWVLLVVLLFVRTIGAYIVYRVHPSLLGERAKLPIHRDQTRTDKFLLLSVLATGFLGLPAIAGLDVFHWHVLPKPSALLGFTGLVLFAVGWCIKNLALRANAFATSVVRLQSERKQVVADKGIYAVIRHPFYAGDPLIYLGLALWLGSYLAALCAIIPLFLMVIRLQLEERFLRLKLPDYNDYAMRVRYRLVPGIW